ERSSTPSFEYVRAYPLWRGMLRRSTHTWEEEEVVVVVLSPLGAGAEEVVRVAESSGRPPKVKPASRGAGVGRVGDAVSSVGPRSYPSGLCPFEGAPAGAIGSNIAVTR